MVIPLLTNQELTPTVSVISRGLCLFSATFCCIRNISRSHKEEILQKLRNM